MSIANFFSFFFNDTATTEIYTLSLHDALPIFIVKKIQMDRMKEADAREVIRWEAEQHVPFDMANVELDFQILDPNAEDRKSTRLNSSHVEISYAVFCLKKKKKQIDV